MGAMRIEIAAGQVFNRLTSVRATRNDAGLSVWLFSCSCGGQKLARPGQVVRGHTKSCGCLKKDLERNFVKNATKHGLAGSPIYLVWHTMRERCTNPSVENYKNYGGRGISVCPEWMASFEKFYEDMGPRPTGLTLERKDSNGNYEKSNCRWATHAEQRRNTRASVLITIGTETKCLTDWALTCAVPRSTLNRYRLEGRPIEPVIQAFLAKRQAGQKSGSH